MAKTASRTGRRRASGTRSRVATSSKGQGRKVRTPGKASGAKRGPKPEALTIVRALGPLLEVSRKRTPSENTYVIWELLGSYDDEVMSRLTGLSRSQAARLRRGDRKASGAVARLLEILAALTTCLPVGRGTEEYAAKGEVFYRLSGKQRSYFRPFTEKGKAKP